MKEVFENIKEKIKNQPIEQFVDTNGNWDLVQTVLDCCCEAVDRVKEEYNSGWIPVSDGLPKEDMQCWATFESSNVDKIQYLASQKWWNGEMVDNKVIAWQPLPAPYQPKGE